MRVHWIIQIWTEYRGEYSVQAIAQNNPLLKVPATEPYRFKSLFKARCEARWLLKILDFGDGTWVTLIGGESVWRDDTAEIKEMRPFK
jgi:hypothetical protein